MRIRHWLHRARSVRRGEARLVGVLPATRNTGGTAAAPTRPKMNLLVPFLYAVTFAAEPIGAQGALSWSGNVDESGAKTGVWRCCRADGSAMFVGEFRSGSPSGPWAYFHADGTFDRDWLSAVYEGLNKKPLPELPQELAAAHPQALASLSRAPVPTAPPETVAMVDALGGGDDEVRARLLVHPLDACAGALARLVRTDLATADGCARAARIYDGVLRSICLGAPAWIPGGSDDALRGNTLTILRWYSLWEITRCDEIVWGGRFDLRVNWIDDDMNRFVFVDPPAPPGFHTRGRPGEKDTRVGMFGRDRDAPFPSAFASKKAHSEAATTAARASESAGQALAWLSSQQDEYGAWRPSRYGGDDSWTTGVSAQSVLALLAGGYEPSGRNKAAQSVARCLCWMRDSQESPLGWIVPAAPERVYQQALATMAIVESAGMTKLPKLEQMVQLSMSCLGAQRLPDGSWPLGEGEKEGDPASTCVVEMVLKDLSLSGIQFDKGWIAGTSSWLGRHASASLEQSSTPAGLAFRDPDTVHAWTLFLQALCDKPREEDRTAGVAWLQAHLPAPRRQPLAAPELTMATMLGAFQAGGKVWGDGYRFTAQSLVTSQDKSHGLEGSWSALQPSVGGRIYTTALCASTLLTPYRYPAVSTSAATGKAR